MVSDLPCQHLQLMTIVGKCRDHIKQRQCNKGYHNKSIKKRSQLAVSSQFFHQFFEQSRKRHRKDHGESKDAEEDTKRVKCCSKEK